MTKSARVIALGCVLWTGASTCAPRAAADDVHLDNGEVIEGRATRNGDKVEIELESGKISLSADDVKHIEKRESSVERFEKLSSALGPEDTDKRMQLADYCRDHGMRDRERQLLQQVIEREPNHAQARSRLGYVKSGNSWVTQAEQMRAQGKVQRDGQWLTREQALERDRAESEQRARANARASADKSAELESKKLALEQQRLDIERQKLELETRRPQPAIIGYGYYGYGYAEPRLRAAPAPRHVPPARSSAWPINGMRDPLDSSWSLPGTRDPRDFTR
jgi:hypothetical protein